MVVGVPTDAVPRRPAIVAPENEEQERPDPLHLTAFCDRRQHSFGVRRGRRQRNCGNGNRFQELRPRFLRRTRHQLHRTGDHRQRIMLSGSRFNILTPRSSTLSHQAVHRETQREDRTLQPHPLRRKALLPRIHQRAATGTAVEVWNVHYNYCESWSS